MADRHGWNTNKVPLHDLENITYEPSQLLAEKSLEA